MKLLFLVVRYTLGSILILLMMPLSKRLRSRAKLEQSSYVDITDDYARVWFHVSSEGEWEQAWPVIESFLLKNKRVHVWYTSESVHEKAQKLQSHYTYLSVSMMPLLKLNVFSSMGFFTKKMPELFFMVRYDFFSEILWRASECDKFILLSATLKAKEKALRRNPVKKLFAKSLYSHFDEIYCTLERDYKLFHSLLKIPKERLFLHDFRSGQIIKRQKDQESLSTIHCEKQLHELFKDYDKSRRVIFGSLWTRELPLFSEKLFEAIKNKELFVLIAPHKLGGSQWDELEDYFESQCEKYDIDYVLWDKVGIHQEGNLILCRVPNLLCELYPYFGHAFVGGGHGRSIHSVSEPFWAGSRVYCGPKVHRSTEFDYFKENSPRHIDVINELDTFYELYDRDKQMAIDIGQRQQLAESILSNQVQFLENFHAGHD